MDDNGPSSADADARDHALAHYETAVDALLEAYRTGTPEAMARHHRLTWHRRTWTTMRDYVQLDLGKRPAVPGADVEITRDDARYLVAREHGFSGWDELVATARRVTARLPLAAHPVRVLLPEPDEHGRPLAESRDWAVILDAIEAHPGAHLAAPWEMTDDMLEHATRTGALTGLDLSGARGVTDAGIAHLARLQGLRHLDLGGTAITDHGLEVLRQLPALETLRLRSWHGGEERIGLVNHRAAPNHLTLRGAITDHGLAHLRGLDGLFGLDLDDGSLALTGAGLRTLADLPHLAHLAVTATDDTMPVLAGLPALRYLGVQDTTASDDGFVALSRSRTLEYLWGRRCHGLGRRGFLALSTMPRLRGLSVSCLHVDDEGLAALPHFPALRELMPMDVPDAGYRHVGACERLESLVLMYCRATTDAATEHVTRLPRLSYYFNSYTTITDRTPALLSTMDSLERITFDACHLLTDTGIGALARLPRLRELRVAGRGLTPRVADAFPPAVRVHYSA